MSVGNSGKTAEQEFVSYWDGLGKQAHLHRFTDAAEVTGMNRRKPTIVKKQPADYLLTHQGRMTYAEVKSTDHPRHFRLSLISPYQWGSMERIVEAGGSYVVFIRRLHHSLGTWFCVPGAILLARISPKHFTWEELEPFRYGAIPVEAHKPPRRKVRAILLPQQV